LFFALRDEKQSMYHVRTPPISSPLQVLFRPQGEKEPAKEEKYHAAVHAELVERQARAAFCINPQEL